jgi:Zinc carboxypeptidase
MKTLRVMLLLLLLLLSLLGFTRSVASPLGSSLDDSTKTYTNATTTLFPMVVAATIRKQKHQQQQQQGNHHHEEDSILGKMRRQGLDVLGAKLLRTEQEEDDDFFKIQVHILLHDDDDGQVLTNLLLGEQDVLDYHVVVPKEDQEEHVNTMKSHLRQSPRNLQQQQTKQQQYETINKNRFQCYRTVEGTLATLQDLASNDTKLASYVDIGSSYEKTVAVGAGGLTAAAGYPIRALRITGLSKNKQKRRAPQVLLTAGLHAREYAPPELLTRLAETLLAGYGVDADITWILNRTVVHIVPLVNPDGRKMAEVESSPGWRKNTHRYPGCARTTRQYGVDLNRQFPFAWGDDSGSSSQSCSTRTFVFCVKDQRFLFSSAFSLFSNLFFAPLSLHAHHHTCHRAFFLFAFNRIPWSRGAVRTRK